MRKILRSMGAREWLFAAIALALILVQVWLDLLLPDFMEAITRMVKTQGTPLADILAAGWAMLACAFGSFLAAVATRYTTSRLSAGLGKNLRARMFEKIVGFSSAEFGTFSISSLITRCTNDVTQVQGTVSMGLQAFAKAPLTAVWAISKIAGKSWQWSFATGATVVVMVIVISTLMGIAVPRFALVQTLTDSINRITRENLTGIQVIRAYNAEGSQAAKFDETNDELMATNLFTGNVMNVMSPAMGLMTSALSLAIYWIGVFLIAGAPAADKLTLFSEMVVFSSYAMQVVHAFTMLTMTFVRLPQMAVSVRRISEVLDSTTSIVDGPVGADDFASPGEKGEGADGDASGAGAGSIVFDHVSFRYPDGDELSLIDVSLTVEPGETVAFIGTTGSGKSTLVNLVPRLFDVCEGRILVDGIDVRDYQQATLRDKIGFVPQKAMLFSGTVASNVSYGESREPLEGEALEAAVREALGVAQALEFVDALPEGIEAPVAQGGSNFSGGQRQRLTIARAVYSAPEIYIFDDSFSALDFRTDRDLRRALAEHAKGTTKLIVAQRIGTIMDADKICVLDTGRVVGVGTHHELLANCPTYLKIAKTQLTEEEIARG